MTTLFYAPGACSLAPHFVLEWIGGESLRERAETQGWKAFFTSDIHTSFWPIVSPHRYTTEDSDAAKKAVVAAGHKLVCRQMGLLDAHMEGRDWVLGDGRGKRSIIDAYAFPMIRRGIRMLPGGLADLTHVQALHDRLAADPAVQRVLAQESGK